MVKVDVRGHIEEVPKCCAFCQLYAEPKNMMPCLECTRNSSHRDMFELHEVIKNLAMNEKAVDDE